jgi:hypothetical protein
MPKYYPGLRDILPGWKNKSCNDIVGDEAPHEAQSTDGISLLEGRCGLDIDNRDWILIAKGQKYC